MESNRTNVGKARDYSKLARKHGNRTRRKVMDKLQKQEYVDQLRRDLKIGNKTVKYHIELLQEDGLVEKTGKNNKKVYYRLTPDGKEVLDRLNIPER